MQTHSLNILRAYWEALRNGNTPPRRMDIDPRGIGMALEDSFIAERIAPGVARLRIAGTRLHDLMGMDCRGLPLSALIAPDSRASFATVLEQVLDGPASADCRLSAAPGMIRRAFEGRLLLLPLRGDDGRITRLLGGLCHDGRSLRPPQRFDLMETHLAPVGQQSEGPAGQTSDKPDARPVTGFAEPVACFTAAKAARAPHLRLVVNRT